MADPVQLDMTDVRLAGTLAMVNALLAGGSAGDSMPSEAGRQRSRAIADMLAEHEEGVADDDVDDDDDAIEMATHDVGGELSALIALATGPHSYATTQINLPGDLAGLVRTLAVNIPDADLAEDGREDEPHVTVLYGLADDDLDAVRSLVAGFGPVRIRLGKVSLFPANEKESQRGGGKSDVVKVDVEGEDIRRLNSLIAKNVKHEEKYPNYVPHVTIAYLKPGRGRRWDGFGSLAGREFVAEAIAFNATDGATTMLPLGKSSDVKHMLPHGPQPGVD